MLMSFSPGVTGRVWSSLAVCRALSSRPCKERRIFLYLVGGW